MTTGPVRPDAESALGPERVAALLDERTARLARRGAAAPAVPTRRVLLCRAGPELFGLPLEAVAEVSAARPCTPVPGAPPALVGLSGRNGVLVSVLDLAACLGLAAGTAEAGHVVLLRREAPRIALRVARALGAVEATADEAAGRAPRHGIAGHARAGGEGLALLDLDALLRPYLAGARSAAPA
ncbi:chemotaxis protein CheW [Methylobacterium oryzihabitans]|uniref:Chemotaxis protein CheW n=1 Tax=Methylobacterium oryzihabitans TaxID=2499852 RepID=A0A3S2VCY6_9HYPH|nr:chemotaxis protein CheW [Methylobacterium oryzihabitans]RVU21551.1 chemotaxis protein CheW [Methylobacterium oryzihabitans]